MLTSHSVQADQVVFEAMISSIPDDVDHLAWQIPHHVDQARYDICLFFLLSFRRMLIMVSVQSTHRI